MQQELREAFRLYDKEGNGYITTDVFRDILHELDDKLSPEELDLMIEEIDADGSGTLDFDGIISLFTLQFPLSLIPRRVDCHSYSTKPIMLSGCNNYPTNKLIFNL